MVKKAAYSNPEYVVAGDMGSDITGGWILVPMGAALSVNADWTGTDSPVGNFKVQGSNDRTNVEDLSGASFAAGAGSGTFLWGAAQSLTKFIRVVYERTSDGTGATVNIGVLTSEGGA